MPETKICIAIGGLGGSGTRAVAEVLVRLGYYLGGDLGGPLDNLWFTLLFKRRSVLLESEADFAALYAAFTARMEDRTIDPAIQDRIRELATFDRVQVSSSFLAERLRTFFSDNKFRNAAQPWGWKEPNTHVIAERLLRLDSKLRYIHVVRDPAYMATSSNQNQLANWGPVLLDRDDPEAYGPFAFWCAVQERMQNLQNQMPHQIAFLSFDRLCLEPISEMTRVLANFAIHPNAGQLHDACLHVQAPQKSLHHSGVIIHSPDQERAQRLFQSI